MPVSPIPISPIFAGAVRLQEWMDEPSSVTSMTEQDRQISEIITEERSRLRAFIRRRVPDASDVEDIVQEVFYELVEANRLLMPIEHVTGWLFRDARNRITDLFREEGAGEVQRRTGRGRRRRDAADRGSVAIARCRTGSTLRSPRASRGGGICAERASRR